MGDNRWEMNFVHLLARLGNGKPRREGAGVLV